VRAFDGIAEDAANLELARAVRRADYRHSKGPCRQSGRQGRRGRERSGFMRSLPPRNLASFSRPDSEFVAIGVAEVEAAATGKIERILDHLSARPAHRLHARVQVR